MQRHRSRLLSSGTRYSRTGAPTERWSRTSDFPANCDGFVLENGNKAACPMALDCVTDTQNTLNAGCEYNDTIYKTMGALKTALGL